MPSRLTQQQLETHLWGAANILRGRTAGQDYKTYILSLMFFKRLSDQWDFEADDRINQLEQERGKPFTDAQRQALRLRGDLHRFAIPAGCHWSDVLRASEKIGEVLTTAMRGVAGANKELVGVFTVDWNQPAPDGSGKQLIANEVVSALVQHFHQVNLSSANVQPDVIGRAYEYLVKQFADDAGAKAGEFFTPPEVVDLLIRILEPQPGEAVYDPTCGSGGMLIHSADFLKENGHGPDQLRYFGQELNWSTYAIAPQLLATGDGKNATNSTRRYRTATRTGFFNRCSRERKRLCGSRHGSGVFCGSLQADGRLRPRRRLHRVLVLQRKLLRAAIRFPRDRLLWPRIRRNRRLVD